jgi:hypothetical protein
MQKRIVRAAINAMVNGASVVLVQLLISFRGWGEILHYEFEVFYGIQRVWERRN